MDAFECIATKLDVREFGLKSIPQEIRDKILEAARLTGTGLNTQHWRFIVVKDRENIKRLAQDSTSGGWVAGASMAVVVLTDPARKFHAIDAGRAVQDMQLAAWNFGVASCLYTGIREKEMRRDFGIPENLAITAVVGFGYPARRIAGKKKDRLPVAELVHYERYGQRG
ncbi:nitroreductase family protein [Nitrososphaera sp.]|uniref:nitroreductase family protein n=1 Tax=Nitrososphaera sp. TaxID=1971748 RepID=UPI00307F65F3